jgi:protein gp37
VNRTSIEWTHRPETGGAAGGFTWNPIRARLNICPGIERSNGTTILCGHRHDLAHKVCQADGCLCDRKQTGTFCTRTSPGCVHCYASAINIRFGNGLEFVVTNLSNIEFFIDERILEEPLRRKKPATIFVGDMFDLFHEAIPDDFLDIVFAVAALCQQHTLQFLTKRADRALRYFTQCNGRNGTPMTSTRRNGFLIEREMRIREATARYQAMCGFPSEPYSFPLPNVWLGTSVESQKYADERIPLLLQTPAAVRFLSVEPMLEAVDLDMTNALGCGDSNHKEAGTGGGMCRGVDWVICGGESGPGARPFNLAWAESLLEQCKDAGVAFFMKQVGSSPLIPKAMELNARGEFLTETTCGDPAKLLVSSKGGDPSEWPEHLRVRQFPAEKLVSA